MKRSTLAVLLATTLGSTATIAQPGSGEFGDSRPTQVATVEMHKVTEDGPGESVGKVTIRESEHGLVFEPSLNNLSAGLHGFHLHENGSCEPSSSDGEVTPAGAAGGHYDPEGVGHHDEPWGSGHLGDLPALYVAEDGSASRAVLAPRLEADDLEGRALMIHAGGDNYSDDPKPLGGGGARVACGVINGEEE